MTTVDYDALRAQTLGAGSDEAVTVNTRALIDKVLARYSGEWTTLRELIQNAADASAKTVSIRFETSPSASVPVPQDTDTSAQLRHVINHHSLKSTIIENDGEAFRDTDWARLKKIAEGNPDETKIGAFGVGFYSVFADCEEPFVSSGCEALAFHWKGDALYTKRLQLPNGQSTKTTFMLPLRNPSSSVPDLLSLGRFLSSSLAFVGLEGIELWLDKWRILKLVKKIAPGEDIRIPKEINRKTKDNMMHISSVTRESAQLDAFWLRALEWKPKLAKQDATAGLSGQDPRSGTGSQSLRSFFSRLAPGSSNNAAAEKAAKEEREKQTKISEDLLSECRASLFVHVNKAIIRTSTSQNFKSELERATKKPPPKTTTVSLLSASYDEMVASSAASSGAEGASSKIFDAFVPKRGKGRVFIGFTTNQTTGLNVNISTPSIIPTVEREAIDLNNRFVRSWNVEILRAAGLAARISWGHEMQLLSDKLSRLTSTSPRKKVSAEHIQQLLPDALELHESFGWAETTPMGEVGVIMEEAFWTCNQKVALTTLSSVGFLPSSQVRREPEDGLKFIDKIPVIPHAMTKSRLIQKLMDYGVISDITIADIKTELENKALNIEQLRHFMEWLAQKKRINELDDSSVRSLLDVAVANDDANADNGLLVLADMKSFLNASRISPEMPVPPSTLPFTFTMTLSKDDLETLGFEDLQMVPWLRYIVENAGGQNFLKMEQDITGNPTFAKAVLPVISKQWTGLGQSSKSTVVELLAQRTAIPTKMGMRKPSNAYFASVKLFDDLPVVTDLHGVKDNFLAALGVRKTIDLGVVFERLMEPNASQNTQIPSSSAKWNHVDLIKYLTSVRADIPATDIARLRNSKICPAETESLQPTQERYLVSELFEPDPTLRRLKLRTLHWPGQYRRESNEGRFLSSLGLRLAPSYVELVELMAKSAAQENWNLREQALRYVIEQHQTKGYATFDHGSVSTAYLPIQSDSKKVAVPSQVFVNERASVLGFEVLRRDLHVHALKFGVAQDPPVAACVERIISNPPQNPRAAREMFSYMATRVGDLKSQQTEALSSAAIIPVLPKGSKMQNEKSPRIIHTQPRMCFLGTEEKYADIFDFVDFGHEANNFLLTCGSKHEPSTIELARRLVTEPAGILSALGDTRYLELLRTIASSWRVLKKDKALVKELKNAKCLLAYKELAAPKGDIEQDDDEESGIKIWELASPHAIIVIDDTITYNLFRNALLAAPMEEVLEDFYLSLGSPEISSLLEEQHRLGPHTKDQSSAIKLQRLLLERTRLFLNDCPAEIVRHNLAWLQKNLIVESVHKISVRWTLKGYSLSQSNARSATMASNRPCLYITPGSYDTFEVSQALVPLLLSRSKPQHVLLLEMMLESSLTKLRSRGYNVDRILRVKAAEARVAEETRIKQLAEEQERIKEQEKQWQERQIAATKQQEQTQMPGIFPTSPEHQETSIKQAPISEDEELVPQKPRGLFSGLSKHFNFDNVKRGSTSNSSLPSRGGQPLPPSEDAPPPYSPQQDNRQLTQTAQPEPVTAPHHLQRK